MTRTEQIVDVLTKARDLIARGWTQRADARSADGYQVYADSDIACAWCARGAIYAASNGDDNVIYGSLIIIEQTTGCFGITQWNDAPERTKEDVLDAFGRAIEIAKRSLAT